MFWIINIRKRYFCFITKSSTSTSSKKKKVSSSSNKKKVSSSTKTSSTSDKKKTGGNKKKTTKSTSTTGIKKKKTTTSKRSSTSTKKKKEVVYEVGDKVEIKPGKKGQIKYIGEAKNLGVGIWYGIRLTEKRGTCDGYSKGHEFFKCQDGYRIKNKKNIFNIFKFNKIKLIIK